MAPTIGPARSTYRGSNDDAWTSQSTHRTRCVRTARRRWPRRRAPRITRYWPRKRRPDGARQTTSPSTCNNNRAAVGAQTAVKRASKQGAPRARDEPKRLAASARFPGTRSRRLIGSASRPARVPRARPRRSHPLFARPRGMADMLSPLGVATVSSTTAASDTATCRRPPDERRRHAQITRCAHASRKPRPTCAARCRAKRAPRRESKRLCPLLSVRSRTHGD